MKQIAVALTLTAVLAAPLAASAQTWPEGTALPQNTLLIVDAQSNRTIGKLVPVDGQPQMLRMIGNVSTRPAADAKPAAPAPSNVLTVGQEEAVYDAQFREQFHIPSGF